MADFVKLGFLGASFLPRGIGSSLEKTGFVFLESILGSTFFACALEGVVTGATGAEGLLVGCTDAFGGA